MFSYDIEETIALDLGTSNSCCYYFKDGTVHPLSFPNSNTVPSIIRFTSKENIIGRSAVPSKGKPDTAFEMKRILGRKYDDLVVQECVKSWPFLVEANEKGLPVAVLRSDNEVFRITPSQFYTYLIRHFKNQVKQKIEREVKNIILTVPAYFGEHQRNETISAAKAADLNVVYLMNEPTAAAIAYACENDLQNKTILIYDLGGGTFDVSILKVTNSFDVIATSGDAHLGGIDFTNRLYEIIMNAIRQQVGDIELEGKRKGKLQAIAEETKIMLSDIDVVDVDLSDLKLDELPSMTITREEFNSSIDDLIERSKSVVMDCLSQAGMIPKDIDQVILIGGSSRISAVHEAMASFFVNKKTKTDINPDEAVARGAMCFVCQKAGINMVCGMTSIKEGSVNAEDPSIVRSPFAPLTEHSFFPFNSMADISDHFGQATVEIHDISPMQYVVKIPDDQVDVIVPKGAKLPYHKTLRYQTVVDYQDRITVHIAQGNSMKYSENDEYEELLFEHIPRKPKGEVKVDVKVTVDAFCQVSFKAFCNQVPAKPTILNKRGSTVKDRKMTRELIANNDRLQSRNYCQMKMTELYNHLSELVKREPDLSNYYLESLQWFEDNPGATVEQYQNVIQTIDDIFNRYSLYSVCN